VQTQSSAINPISQCALAGVTAPAAPARSQPTDLPTASGAAGTATVSNTQPANGRIIVGSGGQLAYVARFGFCGVDTFTYTIRDAQGLMASAVVTINVLD